MTYPRFPPFPPDNSFPTLELVYDREADVLYLTMDEPRPAISREIGDEVLLRVDPGTGEVVGLTVLNLSTRDARTTRPGRMMNHALLH